MAQVGSPALSAEDALTARLSAVKFQAIQLVDAAAKLSPPRTEKSALRKQASQMPQLQDAARDVLEHAAELTRSVEKETEKLHSTAASLEAKQKSLDDMRRQIASERAAMLAEIECERESLKAEKQLLTAIHKADTININIGGSPFVVSRATLTSKGGFFEAMFSGRHALAPSEDGSFYVDRPGRDFEHILAYMRDGETAALLELDDDTRRRVALEADFYALHELVDHLMDRGYLRHLSKEDAKLKLSEDVLRHEWSPGCFPQLADAQARRAVIGGLAGINLSKDALAGLMPHVGLLNVFDTHGTHVRLNGLTGENASLNGCTGIVEKSALLASKALVCINKEGVGTRFIPSGNLESAYEPGCPPLPASFWRAAPPTPGYPMMLEEYAKMHGRDAVGERVLVESIDSFRANFERLFPGILERLLSVTPGTRPKAQWFAAGGAVLLSMLRRPPASAIEPASAMDQTDLDIFVCAAATLAIHPLARTSRRGLFGESLSPCLRDHASPSAALVPTRHFARVCACVQLRGLRRSGHGARASNLRCPRSRWGRMAHLARHVRHQSAPLDVARGAAAGAFGWSGGPARTPDPDRAPPLPVAQRGTLHPPCALSSALPPCHAQASSERDQARHAVCRSRPGIDRIRRRLLRLRLRWQRGVGAPARAARHPLWIQRAQSCARLGREPDLRIPARCVPRCACARSG